MLLGPFCGVYSRDMQAHEMEVFADYHQFYVWDAGMNPQAPEEHTDEDVGRMVKVAPHVVVVQPVRNTTVPVRVEVHDRDPGWKPDGWDHVVECSLDVSTGCRSDRDAWPREFPA